jgi:hypothetical protein
MKATFAALATITVLGAISCGRNTPMSVPPPPPPPAGPIAGALMVSLTTPNSDDGAVFLELKGPSVRTVVAKNSAWRVYADTTSTTTVRTLVVGNLTAGGLVTFQVPDVGTAASYTATIIDVSDKQNRLRMSLTGYALTIAP